MTEVIRCVGVVTVRGVLQMCAVLYSSQCWCVGVVTVRVVLDLCDAVQQSVLVCWSGDGASCVRRVRCCTAVSVGVLEW
jgi:hypothetical protein